MTSDKIKVFKHVAQTGDRLERPPSGPFELSGEERRFIGGAMSRAKSDELLEQAEPSLRESILRRRGERSGRKAEEASTPKADQPVKRGSWLSRVIARLRAG